MREREAGRLGGAVRCVSVRGVREIATKLIYAGRLTYC